MTKVIRINKIDGERKVRAVNETSKEKWLRCIRDAKLLVMSREQSRIKICELTLEACDIKIGGGGHWDAFKNQYHIGKFAEAIGINSKTLRNWMLVYRYVYVKLPKKEQKQFKWRHGEIVRSNNKTTKMTQPQIKKAYLDAHNMTPRQNHTVTMSKYLKHFSSGIERLDKKDKKMFKKQLEELLEKL